MRLLATDVCLPAADLYCHEFGVWDENVGSFFVGVRVERLSKTLEYV